MVEPMEPDNSTKEKGQNTSMRPRMLTQSEKDSLRQDMKESSDWAKAELKRRRDERKLSEATAHPASE